MLRAPVSEIALAALPARLGPSMAVMHDSVVVGEFSHQAEAFDRAPVMNAAETLGALIELTPEGGGGRWLEVACGTGIVSRALAVRVGEVLGVDLTGGMLDVARRRARSAGLANASYVVGDATDLALPDACFDGVVTRFSLHHIPVPVRVIGELARVVRPGGSVIIGDHVTDEDAAAAAWHQEIERLRDPSHWSCLTAARIRELGHQEGLVLSGERLIAFELDFEEWLERASGGVLAGALVQACLAERPTGTGAFMVTGSGESRKLRLLYSLTSWRRP